MIQLFPSTSLENWKLNKGTKNFELFFPSPIDSCSAAGATQIDETKEIGMHEKSYMSKNILEFFCSFLWLGSWSFSSEMKEADSPCFHGDSWQRWSWAFCMKFRSRNVTVKRILSEQLFLLPHVVKMKLQFWNFAGQLLREKLKAFAGQSWHSVWVTKHDVKLHEYHSQCKFIKRWKRYVTWADSIVDWSVLSSMSCSIETQYLDWNRNMLQQFCYFSLNVDHQREESKANFISVCSKVSSIQCVKYLSDQRATRIERFELLAWIWWSFSWWQNRSQNVLDSANAAGVCCV